MNGGQHQDYPFKTNDELEFEAAIEYAINHSKSEEENDGEF